MSNVRKVGQLNRSKW